MSEFKIMDRVFYPFYGKGTVVEAWNTDEPYPIRVVWDKSPYKNEPWSSFTRDGVMSISRFVGADEVKLILVKDIPKEETGGSEVGQIEGVINHNIAKKMKEDNEKMSNDDEIFHVGDHVWSPHFGSGVVVDIDDDDVPKNDVEDAINPKHYKVDGLPEAIDIMNHLMTPEQFEGFLWGNIMKYAYRFGRKGDKGETAGKIAWYANQLKAVEDWMKENET